MVRADNSSCPFCNIVGREPERLLAEKDNIVVFLADPCLTHGHTLVIPKRHVTELSHLTQEEFSDLWNVVEKVRERIKNEIALGCDIECHYRPFKGANSNEVEHLHVHVIPRENEDVVYEKMGRHKSEVSDRLLDENRKELKEKLIL